MAVDTLELERLSILVESEYIQVITVVSLVTVTTSVGQEERSKGEIAPDIFANSIGRDHK